MAYPTAVHDHTKLLLLVVAAWVSSITMLVPWPPTTIAYFSANNVELPHWAVWLRWVLNVGFVMGGTVAAFLALRGQQRAFKYAIVFSALYIAYWLSEYVLAKTPVSDTLSLVVHQLRTGGVLSKIVIAQHQIALPVIHLVFLGVAAYAYGKRRYAI